MRPLFRGEGCTVNEAGISSAGNPLSRALDAATGDPLHAQQMREGYLAGAGHMGPMMRPPGGQMLRPMMKPGAAGMESAWHEVGPMQAPPMGGGPMLGDAMQDQLMRHMQAGPQGGVHQPGFFAQGPPPSMLQHGPRPQMESDWASEFSGPQVVRPPGPGHMGPGADWAGQFARQGPQPGMQEMDAAFQHARAAPMGPGAHAPELHAAFDQAQMAALGPGPMAMGPMFHRPPLYGGGASFMRPPMAMPPPMVGPGMEHAFQQAGREAAAEEPKQQQEPQPPSTEEADLAQAAQMVEMLRNSGNPKFANSQFVSFIDKVSKGDLQFKENTVIDRDGNTVDWDSLYDTEAATATEGERKQLEALWEASAGDSSGLAQAWGDAERSLEEAWKQSMKDDHFESLWGDAAHGAMHDAWMDNERLERAFSGLGEDFDMERFEALGREAFGRKNDEYKFAADNRYLDEADPSAVAQRLLREGRDREALLALEAEVQRNPESSEGWRLLGQLYAELDQDVEAIQCLRKGHECDPYNLDSLLALGVSCTNELDQLPALRYLRRWVENHEDHQMLVQGLDPPPQYEFEAWRSQVTSLFRQAAEANPLDADVFVALGVMENINRNYAGAIGALATACRLRPNDHTVWNKLGATLANSGASEKAIKAYHQGLTLKPNYARSWSNLAIAHANLQEHADAARFYLSSLVLNPQATHIWSFLHTAVLNMSDLDAAKAGMPSAGNPLSRALDGQQLREAIDQRDLPAMTKLISGVLDPATLPMPADGLPEPPDEILRDMSL